MAAPVGGAFLVGETQPSEAFTPEELPAEAQLMGQTMADFLRREVALVADRLEAGEPGLMRSLLQKAGQLGVLAGGLPEQYGGLDLPRVTLTRLAEASAVNLSFAISLSVHVGVGTLPLLLFGTEAQKRRYLSQLASGEIIAAFALSEGNSGSDALAARTRAIPTADGYTLDGVKLWVTNGGFADLFTVFAQLDGAGFTAFLVERGTPGVVVGPEERKMGLHGSSTCRVMLNRVHVPLESLLGAPGQGHRPAFHALNMGRFNIAAIALGAAKHSLQIAALYAKERHQFGRPLAEFGLIQQKLAEMATRVFLLESMVYRAAGLWDACGDYEEYAIESAILKFFGTEVLGYVVDESLQIHGGFGFSEDYAPARLYRDARVFRLFEGANEINRLAVWDQFRRRIERGRLSLPMGEGEAGSSTAQIRQAALAVGKALLAAPDGEQHQEAKAAFADMAALLYALESAALRCIKWPSGTAEAMVEVYGDGACEQANALARRVREGFAADRHRQIARAVLECKG